MGQNGHLLNPSAKVLQKTRVQRYYKKINLQIFFENFLIIYFIIDIQWVRVKKIVFKGLFDRLLPLFERSLSLFAYLYLSKRVL